MTTNENRKLRVVVAISGGGRSLDNMLKRGTELQFEVVGVISSSSACKGNDIAKQHHLPLFIGDFSQSHRAQTALKMADWLRTVKPDWIALAGFLKIFPLNHSWAAHVINIHPALLPSYGGKGMYGDHVHEAVIKHQDTISGATVHFVNERYDDGAIIAQVTVAVQTEDSAKTLAARVFAAECDLYPQVLHKLASGELPLKQGFLRYQFQP